MIDVVLKYNYNSKPFKQWFLEKSVEYTLSNGDSIIIPEGFETDLSSSPRFLWSLFPPYGNFILAALVHDYLYVVKYRRDIDGAFKAQRFIDREMLFISNQMNKNKVGNYIRFAAVRLFGWLLFTRK